MAYIPRSRTVQDYYQKGISALEKKNYDYAIEMLLQVVQEEPRFFEARKELHRAELAKHELNPPSLVSLALVKFANLIPLSLALIYEAQKNYEKAIAFYEEMLKHELANTSYLKKIYKCALKNEWPEVAVVALESLYALKPDNADVPRILGELYRDLQDVEKATHYLKKSLETNPHDQKVSKMLKDIEALRTIKTGGWDQRGSYRSKIKNEHEARDLESATRLTFAQDTQYRELETLKQQIANSTAPIETYCNLIDGLLAAENNAEAESFLKQARERYPDNPVLEEKERQLKLNILKRNIHILEEKLQANPHDLDIQERLEKNKKQLAQHTRSELEDKVARYPNDLGLKYELGFTYYTLGEYDKAISEFQQAIKDPGISTKALNQLGLAFHSKGMYDLATVQFRKALEKFSGVTNISKEFIYNLGTTLEAMGKKEEAIAEYKKIYEVDIAYRDVAKKIEGFYKM